MNLDTIRAAMAQTNQIFDNEVVAKRDYARLDRVYTRDARILPPGAEMISGREAIKAFWPAAIQALDVKACELKSVEVIAGGDGIVEIGSAVLTTGAGAATGKYIVYWREEDGAWKWHLDIWNMNA